MFSIRMRASVNRRHVSGAERIIPKKDIPLVVEQLSKRAATHENGIPDIIHITIEKITDVIQYIPALPLTSITIKSHVQAKGLAVDALIDSGIPDTAAHHALELLQKGPAPDGGNMRGAIIMNCENKKRLEPDSFRGVRVIRMDMKPEAVEALRKELSTLKLDKRTEIIREAITLASKVANFKTIAELCISDNPSNHVGYVASKKLGFLRIPHLKKTGSSAGGRVFLVRTGINLHEYINYLEHAPVIVDQVSGVQTVSAITTQPPGCSMIDSLLNIQSTY
ncbi:MAG: 6-carboxyhexanoate--CoA ligase [Candidatus Argoarchaeum ethanivorans]|uniref:6-carboxyhexanoate--CoA ligase n=1 Tax=Candidatus Argoarchaeum ethanivorans TaxID=2608793 RepID=A0A811TAE0_9EURY|nr:MAG: 6-carboxyhexanoate--CoA ligase [Candidatus Argoarchaeum ethanivorans]